MNSPTESYTSSIVSFQDAEEAEQSGKASHRSQKPPVFHLGLACVTFNDTNILRFIRFPPDVVEVMHDVIRITWPQGLKKSGDFKSSYEFKLQGRPWSRYYSGEDDSRRLLLKIYETLYDMGWVVHSAADFNKNLTARDTLIFQHQGLPAPPCDWACVSLDRLNKLRVVPPPEDELGVALLQALGEGVIKHEIANGHLEVKFSGTPWIPRGEDSVKTPLMMMAMLETFERFGYNLYSSLQDMPASEGRDSDILIMQRQGTWIPGSPMYHI